MRVLVVDDDPTILHLLGLALPAHGLTVRSADNGTAAVSLYREHRASIDVVLLDVQMPGLDGPHTLAALREIDPDVRCCFMSGLAGSYSPDDLLALGAADFFPKPFGSFGVLAARLGRASRPT
jgi:DNA-binding response OmpR family regulator